MRSLIRVIRGPLAVVAGLAVAGGVLVAVAPAAQAATFTVTNTDDSGPGSLRQAILDANTSAGADVIDFALDGAEPHTIQLTTAENLTQALPSITDAVRIDGTTQEGYAGTPVVELVGQGTSGGATALWVESPGSVLKGLSVRNFVEGVYLASGSSGAQVVANQFGTTLDGLEVSGQWQSFAIGLRAGSGHVVQENLIANAETGVSLFGAGVDDSTIVDNAIGVARTRDFALPVNVGISVQSVGAGHLLQGNQVVGDETSSAGIELAFADAVTLSENVVGGVGSEDLLLGGRSVAGVIVNPGVTSLSMVNTVIFGGGGHGLVIAADEANPSTGTVEGNSFYRNALAGVRITGTDGHLTFRGNSFVDNGQLGIDVGDAGVSPPPDGGPVISAVAVSDSPDEQDVFDVDLAFDGGAVAAGQTREIEFFANSFCDPSGFGEGEGNYDTVEVQLDDAGVFSGTVSIGSEIGLEEYVTATVVGGASWQQSEFSNCYPVPTGPVNSRPVASDTSVVAQENDSVVVQLQGSDADGDALTFVAQAESAQGGEVSAVSSTVCEIVGTVCTAEVTYTAPAGFVGADAFTFTVTDGQETSEPATVTIDVQPDEPQADLSMLTVTDLPDPVTAGGVVAYRAEVKNLGPGTATGVTVDFYDPGTDALPLGTTFLSGSVSSSAGGGGTCAQSDAAEPIVCTLGAVPASATVTWTATVYLQTSGEAPAEIDIRARVEGDQKDPVADNQLTETTTIDPFIDDTVTEFVPPSVQTETVATAETVLINGTEVPIAQPGNTTAAAMSVPPGGPGGVVTVAELNCEPPFCAAAPLTLAPNPTGAPIDDRVVQFIPPSDPFYDYQHPVRFTVTYDRTVVGPLLGRKLRLLYTKESEPDQLLRARWCPKDPAATTVFPCIDQARILRTRNPQLRGDQLIVLLGTYRDPKIAGFR